MEHGMEWNVEWSVEWNGMEHGNTKICNDLHLVVLNIHPSAVLDIVHRFSAGKVVILRPSN